VLGHKSFSMTLRYAHLSPMHLRTAVESLNGLTPTLSTLDQWTHKMAQNTETMVEQKILSSSVIENRVCARSSVG